jgi:hypothetical protein
MKEDIKKWLESNTPDYNTGVLLFAKYSRNRSLLHFLTRKGNSDATMLKLRYELGKIANGAPVAHSPNRSAPASSQSSPPSQSSQIKPVVERVHIDIAGRINPDDLPEELQVLYKKNVKEHRLMSAAHAAMAAAKNRTDRRKFGRQVRELDDAIAARWATIDAWVAGGQLPTATDKLPAATPDDRLTAQEVNAYRTYISRGVADPDKLSDDKRAIMQERIAALLADGQKFDDETIAKLSALGFSLETV